LESDDRHERRTAIIARELARYKIDIAALSEKDIAFFSNFERNLLEFPEIDFF